MAVRNLRSKYKVGLKHFNLNFILKVSILGPPLPLLRKFLACIWSSSHCITVFFFVLVTQPRCFYWRFIVSPLLYNSPINSI